MTEKQLEIPDLELSMTFEAARHFKLFVKVCAGILNEIQVEADKNGLTLCMLDSSKASMLVYKLEAASFKDYTCKTEGNFCVPVDELAKAVKVLHEDDTVRLDVRNKHLFVNLKQFNGFEKQVDIQCMTPQSPAREPKLDEFQGVVEIPFKEFKDTIKLCTELGSAVLFKTAHKKFIIETLDAEVKGNGTFKEDALFYIKPNDAVTTNYATSYLSAIVKGLRNKDFQSVLLKFNSNKPLTIELVITAGQTVHFILAPRVERR